MIQMKYPILMVHGMGFRDRKYINYWGRIPKRLKELGCEVYHGYQDSNASIETNAETLKNRIEEILAESKAKKLNVIAHSKGGLEMRYVISTMGMGEKIASLTTINTPHHGSITVDKLLIVPDILVRFGCKCTDVWMWILGDKNPDTYAAIQAFRTDNAEQFNQENPDVEGIYYQSYAFVMKHAFSDIFMFWTYLVVYLFEGENDGLLAPRATKWTNFQGVQRSNSGRGISHCDQVDMRRWRLTRRSGDGISDMVDFYVRVIRELKEKGY